MSGKYLSSQVSAFLIMWVYSAFAFALPPNLYPQSLETFDDQSLQVIGVLVEIGILVFALAALGLGIRWIKATFLD